MFGFSARVERLSPRRRTAWGGALAVLCLAGLGVAATAGGLWALLLLPSGFFFLVACWMVAPWFHGLPDVWRRRGSGSTLVLYAMSVAGFILIVWRTAQTDAGAAAVLLAFLWPLHALYVAFEPTDFAWDRLRARLGRAVHLRVVMLWAGLAGVVWLANWAVQDSDKYRVLVLGATLTLTLAGVAASLKVYARFRKLCTALNRQAQSLLRSLEELADAADDDRTKHRQSALRAWDTLHELVVTKADTGFSIAGVFVLPPAAVEELEQVVMTAVEADRGDEAVHRFAAQRLRAIQEACRGRIDAMA
ncbi:hypothetical protein [Streptomyces syringium]|uniref:hypothetical protein n=1 Tax=Streptomyces syringium TaxID=76729 RepID=UPI00340C3BA7